MLAGCATSTGSGSRLLPWNWFASAPATPTAPKPVVVPPPNAAPVVAGQQKKDDQVLGAAGKIDDIVAGSPTAEPVQEQTDAIRAAVAANPAADVAAVVASFGVVIQSYSKAIAVYDDRTAAADKRAAVAEARVKALEDAELKAQAKTLRFAGLAALLVAGLLGYARQLPLAAAAALGGLVCLGLAQLVSQPWFMPAVAVAVAVVLVAVGIAAFHAYRKGDLAKKTQNEAARLKSTLARIIPTLDAAYDGAEADVREVLDKTVFSSLSRVMNTDDKATVHELRANLTSKP